MDLPAHNLVLAWVWLTMGFVSGLLLGSWFHREDWLGGYGSFRRRLYRLGHISFFGLGMVNFCFYFTLRLLGNTSCGLEVASWAFVVGALTMPACCLVMAHFPRCRLLFAVPVLSLLLGGSLTVLGVIQARAPVRAPAVHAAPGVELSNRL
jgi:hypothetical protein